MERSITESSNLVSVLMNENSQDNPPPTHQELNMSTKVQKDIPLNNTVSWAEQNLDTKMEYDEDEPMPILIPKLERPETPTHDHDIPDDYSSPHSPNGSSMYLAKHEPVFLTKQELEEWKDVIKMNDYLTKGRRPHFWEEPFCKRVWN